MIGKRKCVSKEWGEGLQLLRDVNSVFFGQHSWSSTLNVGMSVLLTLYRPLFDCFYDLCIKMIKEA